MEQTIKERTARGEFRAQGSSGARARRYNDAYARREGKPLSPVNLRLSGNMMDSLRGQHRVNPKSIRVLTDFTNEEARRLAEIHEEEGAGRTRIRRVFNYLTKSEAMRITKEMIRIMKSA